MRAELAGNLTVTIIETVSNYCGRNMGSRSTEVGRTGARFGQVSRQRSGRHELEAEPPDRDRDDAVEPADADAAESDVGRIGARFGSLSERRRNKEKPAEVTAEIDVDLTQIAGAAVEAPDSRDERLPLESEVLIRPYARTRGRTRPAHDLAIEALISTIPEAALPNGAVSSWEHRMIANLCVQPRSVAEVAALLSIPLGVARILLVDMASDGVVLVHGSTGHRAPDLILMQRVLAGLRRL